MHDYKVVEDREDDEEKCAISSLSVSSPQDGAENGFDQVSGSDDDAEKNSVENHWNSLAKSSDSSPSNHCSPSNGELVAARIFLSLPEPVNEAKQKCENENEYEADDEERNLLNWNILKIAVTKGASDPRNQNQITKKSINEMRIDLKTEESAECSKNKKVRTLVDVFFTVAIVSPLVVGYWRGHWILMDIYLESFSSWGFFILGVGLHTIFAVLKYHLHAKIAGQLRVENTFSRAVYHLLRITYVYIFATACIMQWRGGWTIFDNCTVHAWMLETATVVCVLILARLRCVRNLLASPFIVVIDNHDYIFKFPTRFNSNSQDWALYVLDCAFSVGVVGTLVVFVWRGVWVSFDLYLFPDNAEYSAVGSVVIGYTIVVITFSLQPVMRWACTRLEGLPRLITADVFMLLSFIGTVNVWRGVWNVLGLWFLPENPELSCWITHLGCFMFLVLLNCSNSILVRGVLIDAEEEEGKCVVFPCHYLRLFFKIEREKKEARRQNLVVASRDLATIMEHPGKEGNGSVLNVLNPANVIESPESPV